MDFYRATQQDKESFDRDGFLIIKGLFSAEEIGNLHTIVRADDMMASAHDREDRDGRKSKLSLRNDLSDDIYSTMVRCRRMAETASLLLDDEVYHFHHKMMLKEPRVGGAWEWHQDYGYWYQFNHCLYPTMASCFIAVDRAHRDNGCLQVVKGSHRLGRLDHGMAGSQSAVDPERMEAILERLGKQYVELEPGSGAFFHANLLHYSEANLSDEPRWTLVCCYNTRTNSPYKEVPGGHPCYSPMEIWPDDKVLEIGRRDAAQVG